MKALDLLATNLNRKDDEPNQVLADKIIKNSRKDWVQELVSNLYNKDKNIQSDCIKVLYEIGERGSAELIAPFCEEFFEILKSKNNRLVWGAMIALDRIALIDPKSLFSKLSLIISTIDNGSVISIDHGVGILAKLSSLSDFSDTTFPLLMEQLKRCPIKQLPMYAEKSEIALKANNKAYFIDLLESRLNETERDSQKSRLTKLIKKLKNK